MASEVVLRLDEATARDIYDLLYALGEQVAAGAPVLLPPPAATGHRLSAVFHELERQLGLPSMAQMMGEVIEMRRRQASTLRGRPNCRGHLRAPPSLYPVMYGLSRAGEGARHPSLGWREDGREFLRVEADDLDLTTQPVLGAEHMLGGEIGGDPADARATFERLSRALTAAGVAHQLELDDPAGAVRTEHDWTEQP